MNITPGDDPSARCRNSRVLGTPLSKLYGSFGGAVRLLDYHYGQSAVCIYVTVQYALNALPRSQRIVTDLVYRVRLCRRFGRIAATTTDCRGSRVSSVSI